VIQAAADRPDGACADVPDGRPRRADSDHVERAVESQAVPFEARSQGGLRFQITRITNPEEPNGLTRSRFGTNSFAENPEPRVPCVLLLDVSGSMAGQSINELNAGLVTYKDELAADALAAKRVEVAVVTFGGEVQTVVDFTTAEQFLRPL